MLKTKNGTTEYTYFLQKFVEEEYFTLPWYDYSPSDDLEA